MLQTGIKPENNTILRQTNQNMLSAIMLKVGYLNIHAKKRSFHVTRNSNQPTLQTNQNMFSKKLER